MHNACRRAPLPPQGRRRWPHLQGSAAGTIEGQPEAWGSAERGQLHQVGAHTRDAGRCRLPSQPRWLRVAKTVRAVGLLPHAAGRHAHYNDTGLLVFSWPGRAGRPVVSMSCTARCPRHPQSPPPARAHLQHFNLAGSNIEWDYAHVGSGPGRDFAPAASRLRLRPGQVPPSAAVRAFGGGCCPCQLACEPRLLQSSHCHILLCRWREACLRVSSLQLQT